MTRYKEILRLKNPGLSQEKIAEGCQVSKKTVNMYSQFCFYIQNDEQLRRATMHINHKPGEQIEVDWAGDPAHITDSETGEKKAFIFLGVLSYSRYAYAEAFTDEKQKSWCRTTARLQSFTTESLTTS